MKAAQQELPFRQWGGARKGAGRKRQSARPNVPHRPRQGFRKGALHVTLRMRREVWNLRTHRCFRALRWAFARGCERFGFRLVEFSVQGNHIRASRSGWRGRSTRSCTARGPCSGFSATNKPSRREFPERECHHARQTNLIDGGGWGPSTSAAQGLMNAQASR